MTYFNKAIGPYPYKQYSVVHGGDGGMEYAMLTLITGNRKFGSLVGRDCTRISPFLVSTCVGHQRNQTRMDGRRLYPPLSLPLLKMKS